MTLATIFTLITMAASLIGLAIVIFLRGDRNNQRINEQHLMVGMMFLTLAIYMGFSLRRIVPGQIVILHSPSMLALYLFSEAHFFAFMAYNGYKYYRENTYLLRFNHVLVFLVALVLYVDYVMGFPDKYYSWQDFYLSYQRGYVTFFTRVAIMVSLGFYTCEMAWRMLKAFFERRAEMKQEGNGVKMNSNVDRSIIAWSVLILLMILGQLVPSLNYHIVMCCLTLAVLTYTIIGQARVWSASSTADGDEEDSKKTMPRLAARLRKWLMQEPFPLRENYTMDDIATQLNIDRDKLSTFVYEVMGQSFTSWVSDRRLDYCERLLTTTPKTMSEIAYASGYADLAAMSKAFKRKFGVAPTVYRKMPHPLAPPQ